MLCRGVPFLFVSPQIIRRGLHEHPELSRKIWQNASPEALHKIRSFQTNAIELSTFATPSLDNVPHPHPPPSSVCLPGRRSSQQGSQSPNGTPPFPPKHRTTSHVHVASDLHRLHRADARQHCDHLTTLSSLCGKPSLPPYPAHHRQVLHYAHGHKALPHSTFYTTLQPEKATTIGRT